MDTANFSAHIRRMGEEHYRTMPWREDTRPYYVLVSELMLQQTQVSRVIPKFEAFISRFPDQAALAGCSLADVLELWQGLGYNRRAKFLHDAARTVVNDLDGVFPDDYEALIKLPGVGRNTAGAMLAYAYNVPALFIETNIRTVYFHHFFQSHETVLDVEVQELLAATIDHDHPREFYWALMDYGSWLKSNGVRNTIQARNYKAQSQFKGSLRQMRGMIVRDLAQGDIDSSTLKVRYDDIRFGSALEGLVRDGLVTQTKSRLHLTK